MKTLLKASLLLVVVVIFPADVMVLLGWVMWLLENVVIALLGWAVIALLGYLILVALQRRERGQIERNAMYERWLAQREKESRRNEDYER